MDCSIFFCRAAGPPGSGFAAELDHNLSSAYATPCLLFLGQADGAELLNNGPEQLRRDSKVKDCVAPRLVERCRLLQHVVKPCVGVRLGQVACKMDDVAGEGIPTPAGRRARSPVRQPCPIQNSGSLRPDTRERLRPVLGYVRWQLVRISPAVVLFAPSCRWPASEGAWSDHRRRRRLPGCMVAPFGPVAASPSDWSCLRPWFGPFALNRKTARPCDVRKPRAQVPLGKNFEIATRLRRVDHPKGV